MGGRGFQRRRCRRDKQRPAGGGLAPKPFETDVPIRAQEAMLNFGICRLPCSTPREDVDPEAWPTVRARFASPDPRVMPPSESEHEGDFDHSPAFAIQQRPLHP